MNDPFSSTWLYLLFLLLCLSLGWRVAIASPASALISYGISSALRILFKGWIPALANFPSISVSLMTPLCYWLLCGTNISPNRIFSFFLAMLLVSVHRVWVGNHTVLDVLGGLFIGFFSIFIVKKIFPYKRIRSSESISQWYDKLYVPPGRSYKWSRAEVADRYPNVVTPLFGDLFFPAQGRAVQKMGRLLNLKKRDAIIGYSLRQGRIFANMGFGVLKILQFIHLFIKIRKKYPEYLGGRYTLIKNYVWSQYIKLDELLENNKKDLVKCYLILIESVSLFEKWMIEQSASLLYVTIGFYYIRLFVLLHFPLKNISIMKSLALGHATASYKEDEMLYKLGKGLDNEAKMIKDLKGEEKKLLEEIISFSGFRSSSYDFSDKTLNQDPEIILNLARNVSRADEAPDIQMGRLAKERLDAENRLIKRIKLIHPFSGKKLSQEIIKFSHTLFHMKEDRGRQMAMTWALVKHAVQFIGDNLKNTGWLENSEDIKYFTGIELSGLIYKQIGKRNISPEYSSPEDVKTLVRSRIKEIRVLSTKKEEENGREVVLELARRKRKKQMIDKDELKGKYSLPGRVTARAVIIRNQREFSKMRPGFILVAQVTNPHWDMLFGMARGVVIERGGPLSHAMIKASEYGLPAVIGVYGATKFINDDDLISVDGDKGIVKIIKEQ